MWHLYNPFINTMEFGSMSWFFTGMEFFGRTSLPVLCYWVLVLLFSKAGHSESFELHVKFWETPAAFSNQNSASFVFKVLKGSNGDACTDCITNCTLDHHLASNCDDGKAFYVGLSDGNHTFMVCSNENRGFGCATYDWIVDTVPPTANVTAATSFTSSLNVSINVSFSEPCPGGGGFRCSSTNSCNLIVYGPGQVVPSTLRVLEPDLKFSLTVHLSSSVDYGRVILVSSNNFCTDIAGNRFSRTENSWALLHFDRRKVFVSLRNHLPEKLFQLDNEMRIVQATNNFKNLKVYLYFSEPVLNSSAEILRSLRTNRGSLVPITGNTFEMRKFGFMIENISSSSVVTVGVNSSLILSRQGTPVSPVDPVTFLYDSRRPSVRLSTKSSSRTRENSIMAWVKFTKPVFGFDSSHIFINGGNLISFKELSKNLYLVGTKLVNNTISIIIPENVTQDVAGNRNTASNSLQVRHYSVPVISLVISTFATASFALTAFVASLLALSTSTLQSVGAFSRPPSILTSDPARNLFRIACHIQVFALSRWLSISLPVEYFEFARGIQWIVPYFGLPWETTPKTPHSYGSKLDMAASLNGSALTPMEYISFFESPMKPEDKYFPDLDNSNRWKDFGRLMFWVAVISAVMMIVHGLILFVLKWKKKNSEPQGRYGSLIFPRFEIFLVILALPCISKASTALIKGGSTSGVIVGILLLGFVSLQLLALFTFLSIGITFGKVLEYKEIHREGQEMHWYRDLIRATLGPGKRGQWLWEKEPDSMYLTMFGPLFEDLRGPPMYILSQISLGSTPKLGDRIIGSEDETEDAKAPFIQKLFGILRIYYTLIESLKRVSIGIIAGFFSDSQSSKVPIVILLSITIFQLFFLVLKKPFIQKRVQLAEIISVSSELGVFASCFVLSEKDISNADEAKIGIFMLSLFLFAFLAQMLNEWYALYRQTKHLDPHRKSFYTGTKISGIGILILLVPRKWTQNLESRFLSKPPGNGPREPLSSSDIQRSSGSRKSSSSNDNKWLKQLRKMANASSMNQNDPSTSRNKWSEFWNMNRSGSSSQKSSVDRGGPSWLYKDLENIFASNK